MSKTIIFLADGTWNGTNTDDNKDGVPEETNVLKLYHNLAGEVLAESLLLKNESEKAAPDSDGTEVCQIAKYIHGVGDSDNPIDKVVGGAFGAGIVSRILRGYTFISRNYKAGDNIVILGFSRGAYTARALSGMIAKTGLMNYDAMGIRSKEDAYRRALYVWAFYREQQQRNIATKTVSLLWRRMIGLSSAVGEEQMIPDVPILAVGVWDTVGALGVPIYARSDERLDLFRFADLDLSEKVAFGFHALAIDEHRRDFTPTLWNERNGIEQVWFAGAHADVGGGYVEQQLSDFALDWMMSKLASPQVGVTFKSPLPTIPKGDYRGKLHDSWDQVPYKKFPRLFRALRDDAAIHAAVKQRRTDMPDYAPPNLAKWRGMYTP